MLDFKRAPAADPGARRRTAGGRAQVCATPGNLGGWLTALARVGSMPPARVLGPAIEAAEDGVPLTWMNTQFFEQARATLGRSTEAQRLYLGNGAPRPGKVVTYKELAATFRQVAEGGADAFYRGPIARAIARAVTEAGGWLSEADMAAFSAEWRAPVPITYPGREVCSVPPPFSAFQMLETPNILAGHDGPAWGLRPTPTPPARRGSSPRPPLAYAYASTSRSAASSPRPMPPRSGRASTPRAPQSARASATAASGSRGRSARDTRPTSCTSRPPTSPARMPRGPWRP